MAQRQTVLPLRKWSSVLNTKYIPPGIKTTTWHILGVNIATVLSCRNNGLVCHIEYARGNERHLRRLLGDVCTTREYSKCEA